MLFVSILLQKQHLERKQAVTSGHDLIYQINVKQEEISKCHWNRKYVNL